MLQVEIEYDVGSTELDIELEREDDFYLLEIEFESRGFELEQELLVDTETCVKKLHKTTIEVISIDENANRTDVQIWQKYKHDTTPSIENNTFSSEGMKSPRYMSGNKGYMNQFVKHTILPDKTLFDPIQNKYVSFSVYMSTTTLEGFSSYETKSYYSLHDPYAISISLGSVTEYINEELFLKSRLAESQSRQNASFGVTRENLIDPQARYLVTTPSRLVLDPQSQFSDLTKLSYDDKSGLINYQFDSQIPDKNDIISVSLTDLTISSYDEKYLHISQMMKTKTPEFHEILARIKSKNHSSIKGIVSDVLQEVRNLLSNDTVMLESGNATTLSLDALMLTKKGACQQYSLLATATAKTLRCPYPYNERPLF